MEKFLSSDRIKAEALRLGFSACGLAPAEAVDETVATAFRQWLADGCQAEMAYMQNYEDKRLDPRLLVEGARTVISVALNYYPAKKLPEGEYQIAWYAYGKDYHDVMKGKLKELFEFIEKEVSFSEETDSTIASTNRTADCNFPHQIIHHQITVIHICLHQFNQFIHKLTVVRRHIRKLFFLCSSFF